MKHLSKKKFEWVFLLYMPSAIIVMLHVFLTHITQDLKRSYPVDPKENCYQIEKHADNEVDTSCNYKRKHLTTYH